MFFDPNEVKTNRLKTKLLWKPSAMDNFSALLTYSSNSEKGDTGRNYFTADDPRKFIPVFQRVIDTDSKTTSLKLDYAINDGMSLDVLMAVMDYQWGFDGYEAVEAAQSQVRMDEDNTTLDAKLNFGLNSNELTGFVGLAYFKREQDFGSTGASVYHGTDTSDSKAIYGEVSYDLAEDWTVIAGGRVERESQKRDFNMAFRGDMLHADLDREKTINLPKLVLQYRMTDDTTVSLSGRRGYNGGGGAITFVTNEYYYFDAETVNTYELSTRSSLAGSDVNLSTNVFYNDYDGYQALSSSRKITNMDQAVTYGLELELTAMLTEDFQLNAGLGLLETEIKDAGDEYPDAEGNELNSAPGLTASLGGKYWVNESLNVGVSANYIDEYYGDLNNTKERMAGDFVLMRLNASYETDNWLISAFVNNALDKEAITVAEPAGGRYPHGYAAIVDPRNVGVSVTYSF